jgi:hypothetical protein
MAQLNLGVAGELMIGQIRSVLELLYFGSGIVVAVGVLFGLQQIGLLKKDIRLRNERAAKENAIQNGRRYLCSYVNLLSTFISEYRAANLNHYSGPIGSFTAESVLPGGKESWGKRYGLESWLPAMNELESISAAFISGVADEQTGFQIIGRSFCRSVEANYDLIAFSRSPGEAAQPYWRNIVELYRLWSPRLKEAQLRTAIDHLEARIATVAGKGGRITPIGTE